MRSAAASCSSLRPGAPRIPPAIELTEEPQRDTTNRRDVLADQQRPERHHPETQYRQETKHTADDKHEAERPPNPSRLRPDQPCVELPDTKRQSIEQALQVRIVLHDFSDGLTRLIQSITLGLRLDCLFNDTF